MKASRSTLIALCGLLALPGLALPTFAVGAGPTVLDPPLGGAAAVVDLATLEGARLVKGQWRYHDVKIVEVDSKGVGADLKPTGAPIKTYDYTPKAGVRGFDDSKWEAIAADTLDTRRSTGKVCFAWYRTKLTIPERVGALDPTGSTVALEVVVDDYAEVWVNGELPLVLGQAGGQVVKGFNAPNRVIVGRSVKPGDEIEIAVFGMNGPISRSPENFIWIKSATLEFHPAVSLAQSSAGSSDRSSESASSMGRIVRLDPALDRVVPADTRIEKLATGFQFTEGPVWVRDGGYLLFSDPNANLIFRRAGDGGLSVFRVKSGYAGVDVGEYKQPGSNGLTLDREGRVTINQHGNRRVIRLERNGQVTVLADRFDGKRLNSPNDLVYKSDGALYFTDPPFGLPKVFDDSRKELPWSGVYRVAGGKVELLTKELTGPNGIAFSPDEKQLYVGNWDPKRKVVMRYPVKEDGSIGEGSALVDFTDTPGEDAIDGVKVDQSGNLYISGPGGLWIVSPEGKRLGTIVAPEHAHNFAWGDDDGQTLYMTARSDLYRVRLATPGVRP